MSVNRISKVALCAALVVIATFVKFPLGFIPVMFTAQVYMVLTAGLLLGAKDGALALTVYLLIGLIGAPVFSRGGGFGTLAMPEGGYLVGFIVMAAVCGALSNPSLMKNISPARDFIAALAGIAALYIIALPYIAIQQSILGNNIAAGKLFSAYFLSFLPLDIVKGSLAAITARGLRRAAPSLFAR